MNLILILLLLIIEIHAAINKSSSNGTGIMTCDHKLTNHNINQFQPITAVHSQITTCEVKGYVTTVGDKLSVLAGFIANLTLTDSVNIDLYGWYSSNIT